MVTKRLWLEQHNKFALTEVCRRTATVNAIFRMENRLGLPLCSVRSLVKVIKKGLSVGIGELGTTHALFTRGTEVASSPLHTKYPGRTPKYKRKEEEQDDDDDDDDDERRCMES